MPRRAARFFRFSLSLSLSLSLSFSFPLSVLYLPSYLSFLSHTLFFPHTSLSATMFSLRTAQPVQVCLAFLSSLLLPFSILNQRHPPPLPIDISCIIFFLRPIPHSCHLPNFPTLFSRTNCFFAFFLILFFIYIFFNLCCLSNNAYC